jgi:hypothetical protein
MSLSLNKVASILSERAGRTFDIPFQEEMKDIFIYWIATIRKQSLERNAKDRRHFQQSFVAELEQVPLVECPVEYGCVLRTKEVLPSPLRSSNVLFDYVGSALFSEPYGYTDEAYEMYMSTSEYTGSKKRYAYRDNKLYIYNDKKLKYIGVRGVFEDPRELDKFRCNKEGDPCYSDDLPFPATDDMIQQAISAILKTELRLQIPEDRTEVPTNDNETNIG